MFHLFLALLYAAQLVVGSSSSTSTTKVCNHDNCLRAVIADAFTTRHGVADCESYLRSTVVTNTALQTIVPSLIPKYASACSGSVRYSSACACVSATPTITTATGYVIVSPTSCPFPNPSPTGTPIGQSDSTFSAAHGGLMYEQFPNSMFILSNATSGPYYADFSDPQRLVISDTEGDTLIIYSNGTYLAFAGNCELEFVGSWKDPASKRDLDVSLAIFNRQVSSALCNDVQFFCNTGVGVAIAGFGASFVCASIGEDLGAEIGGGIGFLGNIFGPEVGIPTTLLGVALGGQLGAFVASRFGQSLCGGAAAALTYDLCQACPPTTQCGPGTITCNNGPCQDALSDPNNCGKCGNVCPSGICQNAQCSAPTCDGSTCASLNGCGSGCFCFETSDSTGFCGPDESCAPLADCNSTADCAQGDVCATGTCCGRNVCLQGCGIAEVKRRRSGDFGGVLLGRNVTELWTGGMRAPVA